ncbi:four-helix bundle copper-binding protein [Mycobacterium intracellulare]|uniref:four-helix bundle copper-binding protein n=1 Tax=Mycobacterium intracellulare TaxID=1767 RepID=UPI001CD93CD6|nr:four-helix bundle copper-binding protein [Mycobacterium intracellulare]MCA2306027.1 four-helix bundle copper-binding protein [Mycobacterium intracellulare]MCA2348254.1 four-helix bundle copper-binding protein [Mycobacterium intracellulare]
MTTASSMLKTYPQDLGGVDKAKLTACIEACIDSAQACTACAGACLSEAAVDQLRKCIRACLDCADIYEVTGRVLSRHTGYDANLTRTVLETCAITCKSCADECEKHTTHHEHCRVCGEVCRRCERACRELIGSLG